MRVVYDATPAAVQRAGVGRYARELLKALLQLQTPDRYTLACACPADAAQRLLDELPPGAWRDMARLPISERAMTIAFQRAKLPIPIEWFIGVTDVFHATDYVAPPTRAPVVATVHDLSFLLTPQFGHPALVAYLSSAVPRTLRRASYVIAVSSAVAAEVADAFPFVRERLIAVPNGTAMPEPGSPTRQGERPVILTVGTIEPRKNLESLLGAIELVRSVHRDALLVVVGRVGWRADAIVARLQEAVKAGWAEFIDSPGDAELERQYARATVFAYPSWYEGFGLPVVEAFARGIPVVASDIPALREVGEDIARFARPDDSEGLAGLIGGLLDDDAERRRLGQLGVEHARRYTWSQSAQKTHRAYQLAVEATR